MILDLKQTIKKIYRLRHSLDAYLKCHRLSDNEVEGSERQAEIDELLESIKEKLFFGVGDTIQYGDTTGKVIKIKIAMDYEDDSINITLILKSVDQIKGVSFPLIININNLLYKPKCKVIEFPDNN